MESLDARTVNDLFLKRLDTEEGMQKVAMEGAAFVRRRLREVSFARQILPPQYVTQADLQPSVNHDGVIKMIELEPDSKAMVVNFRDKPSTNYIEGKRVELPFHSISSEEFQKVEEELLAYRMPLTQIIEQNSVLDIQEIEDTAFIGHVDAAITVSGNAVTGSYTNNAVPEASFRELFDKIDGKRLQSETLLMSNTMFNRLVVDNNTNGTFGDDALKGEIAVKGYGHGTLYGRKLIVTNKTDLLDNKIYAFAAPHFMGEFCVLNDTKFDIEKKRNLISFSAYETVGMIIANANGVAKLTLS